MTGKSRMRAGSWQRKTADPGGEQSTYPESNGLRPEALELLGYLAKEKE